MPTCRVLIVDDQRDIRRVLRAALETLSREIQITDVPSGEEAILVISRQPIDVMIADVRLPGISGLELISRARIRNPTLRLVLITGMTDDKVRRQVESARADAFFYKPIEIGPFLDSMQKLLGLAQPGELPAAAPLLESPLGASAERFIQLRTAALRKELDAGMAALVDPAGEFLAQDGSLTLPSGEWQALFDAARRHAAAPGGLLPEIVHLSDGAVDCLITPVRERLWLIAGARRSAWKSIPFGRLVDALHAAVEDLRAPDIAAERANLPPAASVGLPLQETPDPAPSDLAYSYHNEADSPEDAGLIHHLDVLFGKTEDLDLTPGAADAFWDAAAENHGEINVRPNGLTFEQARQMGLAPDED